MIVIAEVLTNCEDDEYRRVRVKSPHVWEESDLMPSLGTIYLNEGDQVIVDISDGVDNAYIRGKIRNKKQKDEVSRSDVEGVLLYEAIREGKWSAAWVNETSGIVTWKNSDGVTIEVNGQDINITTGGDISVNCTNATVKSDNIELDGKVKFTHGFGPPDGKGPLCGIPNCLFSGAPQGSSETA